MLNSSWIDILFEVLPILLVAFSAILHEVAHGWVAYMLGDPTAKNAGRLTLNPKAHLDPFGSIILPLVMTAMGGPIFAFAKPVPYNPYNLKHGQRDEALVALAGPASNLLQACLGAVLYAGVYHAYMGEMFDSYLVAFWALNILNSYVTVNLCLMFFNLIPLPPLDGFKIVMPLLHGEARRKYYQVQRYAMPILFGVLYLLPSILKVDVLGSYLDWAVYGTLRMLLGGLGVL